MFDKIFRKTKTNFENESKTVHCEITGKETSVDNTVILVRIDAVIVLKNLNNPYVDFENNEIQTSDKNPVRFYSEIIVPDDLKPYFGRVFSIVNDVDDIEQSTAIISKEGQKKYSGEQLIPFLEYVNNGAEELGVPPTMFLTVIDTKTNLIDKTCQNWNNNYKGLGKKYRYKVILKEQKHIQTFGIQGVLMPGFDVALSDCCQHNPNGTGYMYKTDNAFKTIDLSSNESAVSFCKKNNSLVYYNDFLNKGKLRVLSSVTEDINKNMKNSYIFRSSNI